MTKFILVGGSINKSLDGGKSFCAEIIKDTVKPVKLLISQFARSPERWEVEYQRDKDFFTGYIVEQKIELRLADYKNFIDQIEWADVIFLKGGSTNLLLESLTKCPGWEEKLSGKVLIGSSAGANAIAKYNYSMHSLLPREGLGLLPIKVLVHYRSDYNAPNIDWDKAEVELKAYKENLPFVPLKEGEFKVFER